MAKKSADLRQAMLSGGAPAARAQRKLEDAQPPEDSQVRQGPDRKGREKQRHRLLSARGQEAAPASRRRAEHYHSGLARRGVE